MAGFFVRNHKIVTLYSSVTFEKALAFEQDKS